MNKTILAAALLIIVGIGAYGYGTRNAKPIETPVVDPSDYLSDTLTQDVKASPLSQEEIRGLVQMREEEKLARDVYNALYEKWQQPAFANIAGSESTHMAAVLRLLNTYNIPDPAATTAPGEFTSEAMQSLYDALVAQGNGSLMDALTVGATIEDLDIKDLQELVAQTDNADITRVYQNLMKGSRNHLRSFVGLIEARGGTYEAQYLTQEEVDTILGAPKEKGAIK